VWPTAARDHALETGEAIVNTVRAVVVAFNPPDDGESGALPTLCASLLAQGCSVEVIDNASHSGERALELCQGLGATLTRLPHNLGVGGALDLALRATETSAWLLTFDQDSRIGATFVEDLMSSIDAWPRAGLIAPTVVDEASGRPLQGDPAAAQAFTTGLVITSGAVCRVEALREVGGFRSDLFIDFVDFDLCLRLRRHGWDIVIEPRAVMQHAIGDMRTHRLGPLRVVSTNHSPDRLYYRFRNITLLLRDGTFSVDRKAGSRAASSLLLTSLKIVAVERNRVAKLAAIRDGLRDGLAGRSGSRSAPARHQT
jgi:rhamnosyltransferase